MQKLCRKWCKYIKASRVMTLLTKITSEKLSILISSVILNNEQAIIHMYSLFLHAQCTWNVDGFFLWIWLNNDDNKNCTYKALSNKVSKQMNEKREALNYILLLHFVHIDDYLLKWVPVGWNLLNAVSNKNGGLAVPGYFWSSLSTFRVGYVHYKNIQYYYFYH